MKSVPHKAHRGSKTRRERWLQNYMDSHDPSKEYKQERFGDRLPRIIRKDKTPTRPSELFRAFSRVAEEFLDPYYKVEELEFFHRFMDMSFVVRNPPNLHRKDFKNTQGQVIFNPRLALYLLFMSEDNVFERYLRTWAHLQPHISLKIPVEMIKSDLHPGCSCSGCFGTCVRIAEKYGILPKDTSHELLEYERRSV